MYYNNNDKRTNVDKLIIVFLTIISIASAILTIYLIIIKEIIIAVFIGILTVVFIVVIDYEIANMKSRKSILMNIFIKLIGIIFLTIAIVIIVYTVKETIKNAKIKKEGIQLVATIRAKHYIGTNNARTREKNTGINTASYTIEYTIGEEKYIKSFNTERLNYKNGNQIYIYYMPNDIDEIYIPIEQHYYTISICIFIFIILGIPCIIYHDL